MIRRLGHFSRVSVLVGTSSKFLVCDVWQHIPNNALYKVPGIPRGRLEFGGFKVFDPETRTYFHSGNLIFNENFTHRDDALRHHDKRRAEILAGADPDAQPVQNNDFKDPNAAAVRNLYTDPDAPAPDVDMSDSIEEEEQQVLSNRLATSRNFLT